MNYCKICVYPENAKPSILIDIMVFAVDVEILGKLNLIGKKKKET